MDIIIILYKTNMVFLRRHQSFIFSLTNYLTALSLSAFHVVVHQHCEDEMCRFLVGGVLKITYINVCMGEGDYVNIT